MASLRNPLVILLMLSLVSGTFAQRRVFNWRALFNTTRAAAGFAGVPYRELYCNMAGRNIVGTTGDPQASGYFEFVLYKFRGDYTVNYFVTITQMTNTEVPSSAEIRVARAGRNGGPILRLDNAQWQIFNPSARRLVTRVTQTNNYMMSGTYGTTADQKIATGETLKSLIEAMLDDPSQFYAIITTPAYPNGAVRAQLKVSGVSPLMG